MIFLKERKLWRCLTLKCFGSNWENRVVFAEGYCEKKWILDVDHDWNLCIWRCRTLRRNCSNDFKLEHMETSTTSQWKNMRKFWPWRRWRLQMKRKMLQFTNFILAKSLLTVLFILSEWGGECWHTCIFIFLLHFAESGSRAQGWICGRLWDGGGGRHGRFCHRHQWQCTQMVVRFAVYFLACLC